MENTKKPLILSVDDDLDTLNLIERYLTKSGFDVITYNRAANALKALDDIKPDLILVDVKMPEMNGYEFSSSLQNKKGVSSIPVVFLSVLRREQDKARAFVSGAVDYLTKPFGKEKLIQVIKKHLRGRKQWNVTQMEADSFDLGKSFPDLKRFCEFLGDKLNLPSEKKNRICNIGLFQLYSIAPDLGINSKHLARLIAEFVHLPFTPVINPANIQLGILPVPFCRKNFVVPATDYSGEVLFILCNPFNLELIDIFKKQLPSKERMKFMISTPEAIESLLKYSSECPVKKISSVESKRKTGWLGLWSDKKSSKTTFEDKHATYIADNILDFAVSERASDIHIEPKEKDTIVRFRIDGDMQNIYSLRKETGNKLVASYKALGGLDIADKRRPQDGVVDAIVEGKNLRLRLATTSTLHGESLIIRLLEQESKLQGLNQLGMTKDQVKTLIDFTSRSQGLLLIVGPTGSGKTTTIYGLISRINHKNRSLITVEDPIEYEIPFANQQQINEKAGITFEALLKSSIRQDPDILFIGEIRDQYSAKIAMDFASTGHLTITSLHTSNVTSAIFRLERVGINRGAIADTVLGIVAQRLLKKLCPHCRDIVPISRKEIDMLSPYTEEVPSKVAHPGAGCSKCNFNGYSGREGIYEIIKSDNEIIEMIRSGKAISEIREFMKLRGDYLISNHAVEKAKNFIFSPADVYVKVLAEESGFKKKMSGPKRRNLIA